MQLITMNYLTSFPESLQMCKWYVYFIIIVLAWVQYDTRSQFLSSSMSKAIEESVKSQ